MRTHTLLAALALVAGCVPLGCEDKSAPPASAAASTTQPLGNLRDNPTSIPGRSAAMAKSAAQGMQGAQDAAANAANDISGQSAGEVVVGGLKFAIPEGWNSTPPTSQFTKASYLVPAAGTGALCNFSTAGGDIASNLNRWRTESMTNASGQPVEGETTEHTVAGMPVVIFKAAGTFTTMSGAKQPDTAFRGAIIKAPAGLVFVRLTAPVKSVGAVDQQWEAMVLGFSK